jgi:para-nitrobenzyl esterase
MNPTQAIRIAPIRYAHAARFRHPVMTPAPEVAPVGQICPQSPPGLGAVMGPARTGLAQAEDCLHLAVATPGCDDGHRPVMVFFHGGGFGSGAGLMDWYDGRALAADADVVVVSVNYRLGVLGYLCLDGVSPGNLGLRDQIEALRWVEAHIHAFGGNPAGITVFGQSAGALSIRLLMEIPEARGLFARAILHSGPPPYLARPREEAEKIGTTFADVLGQDPRTAPLETLLTAAGRTAAALARSGVSVPPFYPSSGTAWLPELGKTFNDNVAGLDVVAGWNADDASAFTATGPGPHTHALTRQLFADPITAFAEQLDRAGAHAHTYRLAWRPDGSPFGATHGIELPLLLGTRRAWKQAPMLGTATWDEVDLLGREMRRIWGQFARTGTTEPPPTLPLVWARR